MVDASNSGKYSRDCEAEPKSNQKLSPSHLHTAQPTCKFVYIQGRCWESWERKDTATTAAIDCAPLCTKRMDQEAALPIAPNRSIDEPLNIFQAKKKKKRQKQWNGSFFFHRKIAILFPHLEPVWQQSIRLKIHQESQEQHDIPFFLLYYVRSSRLSCYL